jgi:hypothetical protein
MADPTDRPAQQAEADGGDLGEELVRLDVGGWISGPCLSADELENPADWLPEPGLARPADGSQRPAG